jgi:hypothetical protein
LKDLHRSTSSIDIFKNSASDHQHNNNPDREGVQTLIDVKDGLKFSGRGGSWHHRTSMDGTVTW